MRRTGDGSPLFCMLSIGKWFRARRGSYAFVSMPGSKEGIS